MKKIFFAVAVCVVLQAATFGADNIRTIAAGETYTVTADNWDEFSAYTAVTIAGKTDSAAAGHLVLDCANPPPMPISGAGTIVKKSSDDWTLSVSIPDFTGDYEIQAGQVTVTAARQLGNAGGIVYVRDGATVVYNGSDKFGARHFHIAGEGVTKNGRKMGALCSAKLAYHFLYVTLDSDALYVQTFSSGGYAFDSGKNVYLNGHTLRTTVRANTPFYWMSNTIVADKEQGGKYVFEDDNGTRRTLLVRESAHLPEAPGKTILRGNTYFNMHNNMPTQKGTVEVDGDMYLRWTSNNDASSWLGYTATNYNNLAGPLVIGSGSRAVYTDTDGTYKDKNCVNLSGPFSGSGSVGISGSKTRGRFQVWSSSDAESFTGWAFASNNLYGASMIAFKTNAFPRYDRVTTHNGLLTVGLLPAGEHRWSPASLAAFNDEVNWGVSSFLTIDTAWLSEHCATFDAADFNDLVQSDAMRFGNNLEDSDITLTGAFAKPLSLGVFRGTLTLGENFDGTLTNTVVASYGQDSTLATGELVIKDGAKVRTGYDGMFVSCDRQKMYNTNLSSVRGRLTVTNATFTTTWLPDANSPYADAGAVRVGWYKNPGVMTVEAGSVISNKFLVGSGNSDMKAPNNGGGIGAMYVRGGDVTILGQGGSHLTSSFGINGYGYLGVSGGQVKMAGPVTVGGYGYGIMHVMGGEVGSANNWRGDGCKLYLGSCNGGQGALYVTNATCRLSSMDVASGNNSNAAYLTIDAGGQLLVSGGMAWGCNYEGTNGVSNSREIVTVRKGGVFAAPTFYQIYRSYREDAFILNADGGILRATSDGQFFGRADVEKGVKPESWVRVYRGGLMIDSNGKNITSTAPIKAAEGQGVKAIAWTATSGYVGAPYVTITGDGYGATAIADFDEETGTVKGLVVTSPGWGYTAATASVIQTGVSTVKIACTLEDNDKTGAFMKTGSGTFTTSATNTWGGATIVKGGTLLAACDWAIPEDSAVVLAGGDVDFGGFTGVVSKVTYGAGGGQFLNAENVKKPAVDDFDMTITTEDILAGQPVKVPAGSNLAGKTLTITGDWSGLATENPSVRYPVVVPTSGTLSGMPTIVKSDLPTPWEFRVSGTGVRLVPRIGLYLIIR